MKQFVFGKGSTGLYHDSKIWFQCRRRCGRVFFRVATAVATTFITWFHGHHFDIQLNPLIFGLMMMMTMSSTTAVGVPARVVVVQVG